MPRSTDSDVSALVGDGSTPLRVLVVDDDPAAREALRYAVASLGYPCASATDAEDALAKLAAAAADIVLTDWHMPRMTGPELCRTLRARGGDYVFLFLVTADGDKAHLIEGMRAGADDFMRKPVDLEELEVRLLSAARILGVERRLARHNESLQRKSEASFIAARQDTLTQTKNRLSMNEELAIACARAARYGHRYAAALCDVDHFKAYNDRFGHLAGDDALRRIAAAMRDALRHGDELYRYGGEELVVLLPEQSSGDAAHAVERLRQAVEALAIPHPASASGVVTISVGVAELTPGETLDAWLRRADAALYRAKEHGRNRIEQAA